MLRTFKRHDTRQTRPLDGWWDFQPTPDQAVPGDQSQPQSYEHHAHTPGVWEAIPGLERYRGVAWYRRTITLDQPTHLRLLFGGVSHTADVYLNGEKIAHHYDAFTPFEAFVPGVPSGEHELAVRVDNSFGDHSALHIDNDYYTYGGITRPAEIQQLPDLYLGDIAIVPETDDHNTWRLKLKVNVHNLGDHASDFTLQLDIADRRVTLDPLSCDAAGSASCEAVIDGLDVEAWALDSPTLYRLTVGLVQDGEVIDDAIERVGFRTVAVEGQDILLNGEPIRLRGFNRHEDFNDFGCAVPYEAMVRDLLIIKDLGSNFVRTCHYPNDQRFLDLCDEMGLAVWEEHHARTVKFDHPRFDEQIEGSTREMVRWHHNHPSILMWGGLNECNSVTPQGAAVHERCMSLLRGLDPTRPVTFASNKGTRDVALGFVDIVSWNVYPNWYGSNDPAEHIEEFIAWLDSEVSGGAGKPVIISETGAGAIRGWRHRHAERWTEDYQCEALGEILDAYLPHPRIAGVALWQFCDHRVTTGHWRGRPRNMNNKGIVDEHRQPKLAYDVVKQRLHNAAAQQGG